MTRMTDQIGRVLGGRYRLLSPLGAGASAQVYLADDVRLRRQVAVKVLHPALAEDDSFLRRFRAEAQAAAALSHPHVVAVFDWSDGEVPFLVTEYLGGGSLRAMLDAGHLLSPAQALVVGLDATRALEHAHHQGFVHRDIKPANMLFGEDGRLRIADFGLARAVAEATWTEPAGAVLGTARYASPEQARGESVDGRSDVYSLALVLIEAVTGKVPFTADTTIGTLMARLDHSLVPPEEMDALAPLLAGAGTLDPNERLDAAELGAGFVATAPLLTRPEPLRLAGARRSEPAPTDRRDTTLIGATAAAARAVTVTPPAERNPAGAGSDATRVMPADPGATNVLPAPALVGAGAGVPTGAPPGVRTGAPPRPPGPPRGPVPPPWDPRAAEPGRRLSPGDRSVGRLMLGALVVALAVAAGVGVAAFMFKSQLPSHVVPNTYVGATRDQVESDARQKGWHVRFEETRQDGTQPDQVLATEPAAGTELQEGKTIKVTVSLGPTLVPVPGDIVGADEDGATDALEAVGFVVQPVRQPDENVDEGVVIGFTDGDPPAEGLPKGSTVRLTVSTGDKIGVPDVSGQAAGDAVAQLTGLGLATEQRGQHSPNGEPDGSVLGTDPPAGTLVEPGSRVVVVVQVDQVTVPRVRGMSLEDATAAIEGAGLVVGDTFGNADGRVAFVTPFEGSQVAPGTQVTLIFRRRG
jgi:serine/threonine-protein kinase